VRVTTRAPRECSTGNLLLKSRQEFDDVIALDRYALDHTSRVGRSAWLITQPEAIDFRGRKTPSREARLRALS